MEFFKQLILVILPIITTSLMGYLIWILKEKNRLDAEKRETDNLKMEANANGTKMILLYMLERLHTEYKLQGFVSHIQRDRFHEIYVAYHDLNGNGYGTALWKDVENLEIKNDVETISPYARILKEAIEKGA